MPEILKKHFKTKYKEFFFEQHRKNQAKENSSIPTSSFFPLNNSTLWNFIESLRFSCMNRGKRFVPFDGKLVWTGFLKITS